MADTYDGIEVEENRVKFSPDGLNMFESHVNGNNRYQVSPAYGDGSLEGLLLEDNEKNEVHYLQRSDNPVEDGMVAFDYFTVKGSLDDVRNLLEDGGVFPISEAQVPERHNMTRGEPSDGSEIIVPDEDEPSTTDWGYVNSSLRLN